MLRIEGTLKLHPNRYRGHRHEISPSSRAAAGRRRRRSAVGAALGVGARLSQSSGPRSGRLYGGQLARCRGPAGRTMAFGPARPAVRGREQARRRHQSVDRSRRPRHARRLYAAGDRDAERDERPPARQSHLQHPARHRAGRLFRRHALRHGGDAVVPGARPFPNSSPTPRPIRARSTWPRTAPAISPMSPASISR